jgi:hypothetical protein
MAAILLKEALPVFYQELSEAVARLARFELQSHPTSTRPLLT